MEDLLGSHLMCLYNKETHCTSKNQVTTEKSNEASQFTKLPLSHIKTYFLFCCIKCSFTVLSSYL